MQTYENYIKCILTFNISLVLLLLSTMFTLTKQIQVACCACTTVWKTLAGWLILDGIKKKKLRGNQPWLQ